MCAAKRRELEKERRRTDILNTAEQLFFSKGFENVSLNDIAKELQLGILTLYLYFENKEELFFAIVLRGALILHKLIKEEVTDVDTAIEKLAAFRKAYYVFASEYPDHLKSYNYLISGRFDLDYFGKKEIKLDPLNRVNTIQNMKRF